MSSHEKWLRQVAQQAINAAWRNTCEQAADHMATLQRELDAASRAQNDLHEEISVLQQQLAHAQSCERSMRTALAEIRDMSCGCDENWSCPSCIARATLQSQPQPKSDSYTNQHEVMNPPASAAQGAEARNLNSATAMGLGEVHRASEARPADDVPAPIATKTLRDFGYAPGDYQSRCMDCKQLMYDVDKRCRACKRCAEKWLAESLKLGGDPHAE